MATAPPKNARSEKNAIAKTEPPNRDLECVEFTPFGESNPIKVSVGAVKNIIATRSKSGREPSHGDIWQFLILCKSGKLNPFVKDAYLIGYDSQEGNTWVTKWQLIIAIQALRKRAEGHPKYDGCQCGVILKVDKDISEREGTMVFDGETLVGAWAIVYRKDRKVPERRTVQFKTYNSGKSRWLKDPAGMIVKCAEAAALRAAFPSQLAALYVAEEFDKVIEAGEATRTIERHPAAKDLNEVTARITGRQVVPVGDPLPDDSHDGIDEPHDDSAAIQAEPTESTTEAPAAAGMDGNPSGLTAEELADQERERQPEPLPAKGRKQKSAFETGGQSYE